MMLERSEHGVQDAEAPHMLPTRQRVVLEVIEQYTSATGEACPASYLARRLRLHHSTIQQHLSALHRKGWLRTPYAPASLTPDNPLVQFKR